MTTLTRVVGSDIAVELRSALRRHRRLVLAGTWLVSLVGFGSFAMTLWSAIASDGGLAYDAHSYWLAGRHAAAGAGLYAEVGIGDPGAYRYTPTFAYVMAPLSALPELGFAWGLRLLSLACLRYLMGSWKWVGWSLLFPPVPLELLAVNLTLPLAALTRWALRDGQLPGALTPLAATLKYGTGFLIPYLWLRRPHLRGSIGVGVGALLAISVGHYLIDPGMWHSYAAALAQQSQSVNDAPFVGDQLLFLVPSTIWDFALRLAIAAVMTIIAARQGWDWLIFLATIIAVPTLWLARLAPLVALPRLWWEDQRDLPALTAREEQA